MNWYKKANETYYGYKIAAWIDGRAVSLYDLTTEYSLQTGSIVTDPNGLYLGSTPKFAIDYYGESTDYPDVLLTYEFDSQDLLRGDPNHPLDELLVSKASLVNYKLI